MSSTTSHWARRLVASHKPKYLAIADLIAEDVAAARLTARDRLPALRDLALELRLDYTTVARGFREASRRGLITVTRGHGSVVRPSASRLPVRTGGVELFSGFRF